MYYTIYKITNKVNGKTYTGMHKTDNLDDGYMGSGKLIKRAIAKYGIENFVKEITHIFDNEKDMKHKEKEAVVLDETTYNLCPGGHGGFGYINHHQLGDKKEAGRKGGLLSPGNKGGSNQGSSFWAKSHSPLLSADIRNMGIKASRAKQAIEKRKETYKKIGHQRGEKHSQYGTCWITNGSTNKKIKKEELNLWLDRGYYKGRKFMDR